MNYINKAKLCETGLSEAHYLLSAVCKLTLTGTWEIPLKESKGCALEAVNISEEARFITGYSNLSVPAKSYFSEVIPLEDQKKMQEAFDEALKTHSAYSIKYRLIHQGISERILYQHGELFFDIYNKEPVKMLCICCDITEHQKEYDLATNDGGDRAAFITSHTLRAPLSNIIGLSDMLNEMSFELPGSERIKELLLAIGEQVKHLDKAVHSLSDLMSKTSNTNFEHKILLNVKELILIDDEPLANKIHSRLIGLVSAETLVTSFTDPIAAMHFLKKNSSDILVLLDINMPEMNGWECLDYMKKNNINTNVIILSSSINPQDRQKASGYQNVKGFLNKPITKDSIKWLLNLA